ncbi:DUF6470 family protein [Gorillibacterium timonense]|uniref:DUF6470 family protein n=1 Tax=Gorillibacterium timonense TaxID=1689269 RepID=UPI00071DA5A9|nr:DUF6470 family protein [Gorillibacterium timonense]
MAAIPTIQIRQQYARIGIDAEPGFMKISQPQATVEITQAPAVVSIHSEPGRLQIDQSRAWDALGAKNILSTLDRIHSEARNVGWDHVVQIVQQGDRLADLTNPGNTVAEIGKEEALRFREFNYLTEASSGNVAMEYTPSPPVIDVQAGGVDIRVDTHKPEMEYIRGKLDIYVAQQAMLTITPPQIDIQA